MVDVPTAKRALAALAQGTSAHAVGGDSPGSSFDGERSDHHDVVDSADAAVEDVDRAAAFVETVGLDRLRQAVKRAPDRETRRRGQRALAAFERYRCAAAGERSGPEQRRSVTDGEHFHRGRGTDIRGDRQRGDT